MHSHFSMQQKLPTSQEGKQQIVYFIVLKTPAPQENSNLLNKHRDHLTVLSPRGNIKLIAAKHFRD